MKRSPMLITVAWLLAATPMATASSVNVLFIDPDRYTDASPLSRATDERSRDAVLAQLREHLKWLGASFLRPNDRLMIEVLDVDLAGEIEISPINHRNTRFLRNSTAPRIHLRYVLDRAGVLSSHAVRISDLAYLSDAAYCRSRGNLCYEKRMLDKWFTRTFLDDTP